MGEHEATVSTHISDAIGAFIYMFKDKYLALLNDHMKVFAFMLGNNGIDIQKRAILYILCDVIEHCPPKSFRNMLVFLRDNFVKAASSPDVCVRQAGIYALGKLVEKFGNSIGLPMNEVLQMCFAQFTDTRFKDADDVDDVQ